MAGLGASLDPSGESGTVDQFVNTQTDVVQTDKKQIQQTTSVETVNHVLFKDWIYSRTYTIDTSMKPGHVFGLIRIHPSDCNPYVNYVSQMFKTWTGGMKVRARFMANFANGGSFRIGFMPPIFTRQEIYSMPLSTLTGYPNQDLDPKNTDWTEFKTSDQRNIAYHYMVNPENEYGPQSFGGWVVFYIVGSLVQTLQSSGSVQMVVETAGDFEFRQLSPLSIDSNNSGPLPSHLLLGIQSDPGCDTFGTDFPNYLEVNPVRATGIISQGFILARGLDGAYTGFQREVVLSGYAQRCRQVSRILYDYYCKFNGRLDPLSADDTAGRASLANWRSPGGTKLTIVARTSNDDTNNLLLDFARFEDTNFTWCQWQGPKDHHIVQTSNPIEIKRNIIPDSAADLWHGKCEYANLFPTESVVYFCTGTTGERNIQTVGMSNWLKTHPTGFDTTYMYSLRNDDTPGPLLYLRLAPDGVFTTNAVTGRITFGKIGFYLQYEQELSPSSPLPPIPNAYYVREMMKATKKAAKHGLCVHELQQDIR